MRYGYEPISFASFWRRLGAIVIDAFIVNLAIILFKKIFSLTLSSALLFFIAEMIYETFFIYYDGMTLGKGIFKIRVVSVTGERITLRQSFIRYYTKILSNFFFC